MMWCFLFVVVVYCSFLFVVVVCSSSEGVINGSCGNYGLFLAWG